MYKEYCEKVRAGELLYGGPRAPQLTTARSHCGDRPTSRIRTRTFAPTRCLRTCTERRSKPIVCAYRRNDDAVNSAGSFRQRTRASRRRATCKNQPQPSFAVRILPTCIANQYIYTNLVVVVCANLLKKFWHNSVSRGLDVWDAHTRSYHPRDQRAGGGLHSPAFAGECRTRLGWLPSALQHSILLTRKGFPPSPQVAPKCKTDRTAPQRHPSAAHAHPNPTSPSNRPTGRPAAHSSLHLMCGSNAAHAVMGGAGPPSVPVLGARAEVK